MSTEPKDFHHKGRPKVTSVRTSQTDDPHITQVKFILEPVPSGKTKKNLISMEDLFEEILMISIWKKSDPVNRLDLASTVYYMGGLDVEGNYIYFYCNVQPIPNAMVDQFFQKTLSLNEEIVVCINYTDPRVENGMFEVKYEV